MDGQKFREIDASVEIAITGTLADDTHILYTRDKDGKYRPEFPEEGFRYYPEELNDYFRGKDLLDFDREQLLDFKNTWLRGFYKNNRQVVIDYQESSYQILKQSREFAEKSAVESFWHGQPEFPEVPDRYAERPRLLWNFKAANLLSMARQCYEKEIKEPAPNIPIYFLPPEKIREYFTNEQNEDIGTLKASDAAPDIYHESADLGNAVIYLAEMDAIIASTAVLMADIEVAGDEKERYELLRCIYEARYVGLLVGEMLNAEARRKHHIYMTIDEDPVDPIYSPPEIKLIEGVSGGEYGYVVEDNGRVIGGVINNFAPIHLGVQAMRRVFLGRGETVKTYEHVLENGLLLAVEQLEYDIFNNLYKMAYYKNQLTPQEVPLQEQFLTAVYAGKQLPSVQMQLRDLIDSLMPPYTNKDDSYPQGVTLYDRLCNIEIIKKSAFEELEELKRLTTLYVDEWHKIVTEQTDK
jgi:hypothetical protein